MNVCTMKVGLLATVLGLLAAGQARAGLIIDQQDTDTVVNYYAAAGPLSNPDAQHVSQSFTPTATSMNYFELTLSGNSTGNAYLQLIAGNGVGSSPTVLGTSETVTVTPNQQDAPYLQAFTFATPITLTPGASYTMIIESTSISDDILVGNTAANSYAGGSGYNIFNSPITDFYFQEGLQSVPEPSTFVMAIVGGLTLLTYALWKRRPMFAS